MNISGIYCSLLFFGLAQHCVLATEWVDELTRYAVEDAKFHQVKYMSRLDDGENLESRLTDELYFKLIQRVPVMSINFDKDFSLPPNSVRDYGKSHPGIPIDTSATLFLFVIESRDNMTTSIVRKFIDAVAEMSTYHYSPKYLVVSIARKPSDHVEQLLQYAWTKRMLDFTIVELVEVEVLRGSILIQRRVDDAIIHKLNPFKKVYARDNWVAMKNPFFPNKLDNLWGYPLRVGLVGNLDSMVSSLFFTSAFRIFDTMEKQLNFSSEFVALELERNSGQHIQEQIELNNVDLTLSAHPQVLDGWDYTERTVSIFSDEFCALVPLLPRWEFPISSDFYLAHVLAVSILLVVWICTRLLRLNRRVWQMFNIVCILLGVSVPQQPRDKIGRIVFACLLALFAMYSSLICGSMTKISWRKTPGTDINTIEDLANSGLTLYIEKFNLAQASDLFDGPLKNLKNRMRQIDSIDLGLEDCVIYKNATCLMHRNVFECFIPENAFGKLVKLIEPCFWTDHYSFLVSRRSPYRPKFDEFIMRSLDSGIKHEVLTNSDIHPISNYERLKHIENNNELLYGLLFVSIVGYSLSLIIFICEIIYHRVSMYMKSRVRPLHTRVLPFIE